MTILVLDPGHGGSDPGAVFGKYQEKYLTLKIALKVRDYLLSNYQVKLIMTRTVDQTLSLKERTDLANAENADYFLSIHINAGGGTGWESFIYKGSVGQETIVKQSIIHDTIMEEIKKYEVIDRGKKRANFHVLRETKMSALLIENLFIDTEKDLDLLDNTSFMNDLVKGIGEGLSRALSLPRQTYYKVFAGSFSDKKNAEDRQKLLSTKGIESFVVETLVSGEKWYRVQAGAFQEEENAKKRQKKIEGVGITDSFIINE